MTSENGDKYIDGTSPEFVVLGEVQTQVHTLLSCIEKIAFDTPDLISKLKEELNSVTSDLTKRVRALEKAHQETTATVERLKERLDEKEDTIPKHMKEKYQIHIEDWLKDEEKFTVTRATEHVTGMMEENNVVVVTGSSGSGKSSLIHHVALTLKKQGYTIIPFVSNPDDIIQYRDMKKNQLFIIDDLCDKNYIDETELQIWKKQTNTIKKLFPTEQSKEQGKLKILVSCRLQIYKNEKFKSLKMFTQGAVDLQSEKYCLLSDEKRKMLGNYITNKIPDYRWQEIQEKLEDCHFFPLLCKIAKGKNVEQLTDLFSSPIMCMREDIKDMIQTKPMENCALVMCVLFPDGFNEDFIDPRTIPLDVQQKVTDIINTYEINITNEKKRAQLRDTFKRLDGTYVKKSGPMYIISHDKLYDMVAIEGFYHVTELYFKYAPSSLIAGQFRFTSVFSKPKKEEDRLLIYLNAENDEKLYLKRCFEDLHKKSYKPFFNNQQLKEEKYRNKVMEYINQNKASCDELFRRLDREGMTEERKRQYSNNTYTYTSTPVIEATKKGLYRLIEYLIDIKCDLNKQDSYNCSPLWYSCDGGFINITSLLLKHNVEYVDDLVKACTSGMAHAVKVMVESGLVDISQCNNYGNTPLTVACIKDQKDIVSILIKHSSGNVKFTVKELVAACERGYTDVVRVMLEREIVDLKQSDTENDWTSMNAACSGGHSDIALLLLNHNFQYSVDDLAMACRHGMSDVVRVMVERGLVDLSQGDNENDYTLLTAALHGHHREIVNILLNHNVQYNVDDLIMACEQGMTDAVRVMVERGLLDLKQSDNENDFTLLTAALHGHHTKIVNLLLNHNVQYNIDNLVEACQHGMTDAVRVMVERGQVDLTQCSSKKYKSTPLNIPCRKGHSESTRISLNYSNKYEIDNLAFGQYSDNYEITPLNAACRNGRSKVAILLLNHNVQYNVDDLVIACIYGMTEAVRVMVERVLVDMPLCDSKYGYTPLEVACLRGHNEIVNLLMNYNVYNVDDLVNACRYGMTNIARVMVERQLVDLTLCGRKTDQTPLNAACRSGHSEIALLLISRNVNYSVDDLVEACRSGMTDVVSVMIERGLVDLISCGIETDQTPLNAACENGQSKVALLLLSHNVNYNVDDLVEACRSGMTDVVSVMIERGLVDLISCGIETDQTPLNAACENGQSKVALLLLGHNVNYNVDDLVEVCRSGMTDVVSVMIERGLVDLTLCSSKYGDTPLRVAFKRGHSKVALLLLGHNVNYNVDDLVEACRYGMTDVVSVMIERGLVDLTLCSSKYGDTPLRVAFERGHSKVALHLLSHNVNYNVDDLVEACRSGMTDVVSVMIERGLVDLTLCSSKYGDTPLRVAFERGHSKVALLLLGHNVNYNVDDLAEACRHGMTDVVRVMVDRGLVDLTQCDSKGNTPLNAACEKGQIEVALLLLGHNVNYNVDDFVRACRCGMIDVVRVMVERGLVDLTQCDSKYGYTPLRTACEKGHRNIVNLLLNHNVNYSVDDMVKACRYGMTDAVRVMVDRGMVDVTQCNKYGETPLSAACRIGCSEIVNLLFSHNVNCTIDDFVQACRHGMTEIARLMVERRLVDLTLCGRMKDKTPLNAACRSDHSEFALLLLSRNVNYSINDLVGACRSDMIDTEGLIVDRGLVNLTLYSSETYQTPLNAACKEGHNEIVNLLLSHNVKYYIDDLVWACRHGMTDAVSVMVERGMVDMTQFYCYYGWTPLNAACKRGHREIVRMLLEGGVDPSQRDGCGKIALDYTDDETIMNLLKAYMEQ